MLTEIRNFTQRSLERRKRWFHDADFDLYVWQAPDARVMEMQLCYARGTHRERALTWKHGPVDASHSADSDADAPVVRRTPMLVAGRRFGGWRIRERLVAAAAELEPAIAAFVLYKVSEHCDPPRRFPRRGRSAPDWLRRLRTVELQKSLEMDR